MLGCGNADAGDDAVGLILAERLRARLPRDIEAIIDTTGGITLLDGCDRLDVLILLDAALACAGFRAGEWRRFIFPGDRQWLQATGRPGTHGWGILETLELAQALG